MSFQAFHMKRRLIAGKWIVSIDPAKAKHQIAVIDAQGVQMGQFFFIKHSHEGFRVYQRRIAIVEPVFGNIRTQKKMDRFTMRGRKSMRNGICIAWCTILRKLCDIARFLRKILLETAR